MFENQKVSFFNIASECELLTSISKNIRYTCAILSIFGAKIQIFTSQKDLNIWQENQNKTCLGDFHTQCASGMHSLFEFAFLRRRGGIRFMNFLNNKIEIHHIISVVGTYMNICHIVCLTALLLRPPFFAPLGTLLRYSEE